jgi:hypothetical protein
VKWSSQPDTACRGQPTVIPSLSVCRASRFPVRTWCAPVDESIVGATVAEPLGKRCTVWPRLIGTTLQKEDRHRIGGDA